MDAIKIIANVLNKNKKEKIICTCTKSGCNKNYCECFKNGQKCTSLCRCISCENNDEISNKKNNNCIYECCPANSIYIIKNALIIENINGINDDEEKIKNNFDMCAPPLTKNEKFIALEKLKIILICVHPHSQKMKNLLL